MKGNLFLHVGPPKTGTTTLQHLFASNRSALAEQGVIYPLEDQSHWKLAWSVGLNMWDWTSGDELEAWQELERVSKRHPEKHLLLSAEAFSFVILPHLEGSAERLFEKLKALDRQVTVVVYLRRQDRWAESWFIEYLKHFGKGGTAGFLEKVAPMLDYQHVLDFWASFAGKENLIVRIFEKAQLPDLRTDFLNLLGVADASKLVLNEDLNHRPGLLQLQILKNYVDAFHELFPSPELNFNKPFGVLNSLLGNFLHHASQWKSPAAPPVLSYETAAEILARFEASNARVASEYLGRSDGKLFFESLEPYLHEELLFPETLPAAQKKALRNLWADTCALMGEPFSEPPFFSKKMAPPQESPESHSSQLTAHSLPEAASDLPEEAQKILARWNGYKNIVVSGPQRSGTTFLGFALGRVLERTDYPEEALDNDDFDKLKNLLETAEKKVIQCPALCHKLDEIEREDTLVLFLRRDVGEIHHSEARINWNRLRFKHGQYIREGDYEKLKYLAKISDGSKAGFPQLDFSKTSAEVKYAFWDAWQKERTRPGEEVNFDDLEFMFPELWVEKDQRKDFGPRQTQKNTAGFFAQLYVDTGSDFNEREMLEQTVASDSQVVEFDLGSFTDARRLRFDPLGLPLKIHLESAVVTFEGGKTAACEFLGSNALVQDGDHFLFDTDDPNIYFTLPPGIRAESFLAKFTYQAIGAAVVPLIAEEYRQIAASASLKKATELQDELLILNEKLADIEGVAKTREQQLQRLAERLNEAAGNAQTLEFELSKREETLRWLEAVAAGKEEKIEALQAAQAVQDEKIQALQATQLGKQEEIQALQAARSEQEEQIKSLEIARVGNEEKIKALEIAYAEKAQAAQAALHEKDERIKTAENALTSTLATLKTQEDAAASLVQNLHLQQVAAAEKEQVIEALRKKLARRKAKWLAAQHEAELFEQKNQALETQLAQLEAEKSALEHTVAATQASLAEALTTLENARLTLQNLENHAGELDSKIGSLENLLYEKDGWISHLEQDRRAKTQFIGELQSSLSFRLGWVLTAPFRWIYEFFRLPFWLPFFKTGLKNPGSVAKNLSLEKVAVLRKALKNEPPALIISNFRKLLSGSSNQMTLALPPVSDNSPTATAAANAPEMGWQEETLEVVQQRKIHFFIDHLAELDFHFSIRGWLFAEEHGVKSLSLQATQNGKTATSVLYFPVDRPDVFHHFQNKNALLTGFSDQVEKPFTGKAALSLLVEFEDGLQQQIQLGETQFNEPFLAAAEAAIAENRAAFFKRNANAGSPAKHRKNPADGQAEKPCIAVYTSSAGNYFFREIKALLVHGFSASGCRVLDLDETHGFENEASLHVVVAPHEFFALGKGARFSSPSGAGGGHSPLGVGGGGGISDRLVLLNTEQPSSQWFQQGTAWFGQAVEVWDMNFYSWQRLSQSLRHAKFLPLGFVANFPLLGEVKKLPHNDCTCFLDKAVKNQSFLNRPFAERPIDILFIGHASARRQQFFAKNAALFARYNCYFHLTDLSAGVVLESKKSMNTRTAIGLAQRSKIILNIHHGTHPYFEWHRMILHGAWQRGLVVSDLCGEAPPFEAGRHFVHAPLEELPEVLQYFLETTEGKEASQQIIDNAENVLKNRCDLAATLQGLLADLAIS